MTRTRFVIGILVLLTGAVLMSQAQGTWMVTVTPPVISGRPAFNALITFSVGGALIVSTQNDHLADAGIQQGTWRRTGSNQITSTQLWFVYAPTGDAVGTVKVRAVYDFSNANDLTGSGQQLLCDLTGSNCTLLPGLASLQGKRVQVEELVTP